MGLLEVNDASSIIHDAAHADANIIFGAVVDYTGDFADGWITTAIFVALGAAMVALMVRERHRVAR
jgi:cell division GTPase FtsZ